MVPTLSPSLSLSDLLSLPALQARTPSTPMVVNLVMEEMATTPHHPTTNLRTGLLRGR